MLGVDLSGYTPVFRLGVAHPRDNLRLQRRGRQGFRKAGESRLTARVGLTLIFLAIGSGKVTATKSREYR
jgi:hypothetical protein